MSESRATPAAGGLWAWAALGLAGSLLVALAAPRALRYPTAHWWYHPAVSFAIAKPLVWLGMAALALAWLAIALRGRPSPRRALVVAAAWTVPLALAPPLFSRDVFSYLAQGTILHLGHDPYHASPVVLAGLHHSRMLAAVSPFWRHTTAPYGPLFLQLVAWIVAITGQHLVGGVLLCRVLDLIGLGLIAVHVPRIARATGADGGRAAWLAVASPLMLFGLIVPAHNDVLMIGLLAAGVSVALRGNPLLGVALCAVAATIKVPAILGAVFILVCWARTERRAAAIRLLAQGAAIAVGLVALITVATGVGVDWISTSMFATPARVRLAITPATGVGYTVAWLAHSVGLHVDAHGLESALSVAATALVAVVGLVLLGRARVRTLLVMLAATLLLAAAGGPAAWPWYFTWGLVLLAAVPAAQRSAAVLVGLALAPYLVTPRGSLAIPLAWAPAVVLVELALGGYAVWAWRRRTRPPAAPPDRATSASGAPPRELVRT